jgi:thermitase
MTSAWFKRSLGFATLVVFTACSATPSTTDHTAWLYAPSEMQSFERVLDVTVTTRDTPWSVAAQHGGTVISWHPDAGYATLGFTSTDTFKPLGAPKPKNYQAPSADDPRAFGLKAWSSGWNVWGGGWNVWGGGWTVWGGGNNANLPGQNARIWQKIKLPEATRLAPKGGQDVIVAVIDTGIDLQHPAFQGALTPPSTWWDWVAGDAVPQDEAGGSSYGHGTSVAGIVLQVAPRAKIMPLRVLGTDGTGETAHVIAAMDWAVAKGARVINMSLGTTKDKALEKAIDSATKSGVLVVASAGNTGDENVTYPASDSMRGGHWGELSIGVGSSDLNDRKSRFSTFGQKKIEMVAVGEGVSSPAPGGRMAAWSGTSMAAPMVSGGFALALAERSFSDLKSVGKAMSKDCDDLRPTDPNYGSALGGRLNLERFLTTVLSAKFK